jgi:hypothetical protein
MTEPKQKPIEFLAPLEVHQIKEEVVQGYFEKNLSKLDDTGLVHVASFIPVAVGEIDSLAVDSDGRPVIIEFKKPGADSREAVIQAMDYWVYCSQHFNQIKNIIEKSLKDKGLYSGLEISDEFRLMIVASEFDDRLQRAVSAISTEVMLLSYRVLEQDNKWLIVPHVKLGNSSTVYKKESKPAKSLDDHFRGKEKFRPLFDKLIATLQSMQVPCEINAQPQAYIGLAGAKKTYVGLAIKNKWIRVDLPFSASEVQLAGYITYSEGGDNGYLHLDNENQLAAVASLIQRAHQKTHE